MSQKEKKEDYSGNTCAVGIREFPYFCQDLCLHALSLWNVGNGDESTCHLDIKTVRGFMNIENFLYPISYK